jgi:hypothetical protein
MLRVYFLQQWFNLSDPAVEDALYDSNAMREFVGIDLGREAAPDETTVCKFRKLLVKQRLGKAMLKGVNEASGGPCSSIIGPETGSLARWGSTWRRRGRALGDCHRRVH